MHYTTEEMAHLRRRYVDRFIQSCQTRCTNVPSIEIIEKYFEDGYDCDLALGHYLIERAKPNPLLTIALLVQEMFRIADENGAVIGGYIDLTGNTKEGPVVRQLRELSKDLPVVLQKTI